jgi:hypothetical protein
MRKQQTQSVIADFTKQPRRDSVVSKTGIRNFKKNCVVVS